MQFLNLPRKASSLFLILALSLNLFTGAFAQEVNPVKKEETSAVVAPLETWQRDLNDSLKYREDALALYMEASETIKAKKPFTSGQMTELYKLNLKREELFNRLRKQGDKDFKEFKSLKKKNGKSNEAIKIGVQSFLYYLLIDDNFMLADILFQNQKNLRRILNEENTAYQIDSKGLHEEAEHFFSFKMMSRKSKLNNYLDKVLKNDSVASSVPGLSVEKRQFLIAAFMYQYKYKQPYSKRFSLNMKHLSAKFFTGQKGIRDFFRTVADKFIFGVTYAFGQTIGQYQWVPGKLKGNKVAEKKLLSLLKPMDIFWDKSRNKVTGRIIPGFWNHNAVWVGNEEELKALGIWEHPLVIPHQAKLREGKMVIEALRMGVVMNTLEHFLDIDDIAIGRKENMTDAEVKEKILMAFAQLGKAYDYNFNTNSEKDIICSELVMMAFPEINFLQTKLLDKWSTTPSDLAKETLPGGSLHLLTVYYNGSEINSNLEWHMANLIKNKKTDVEEKKALELTSGILAPAI